MAASADKVVAIAEPDYAYGTGVLYLRIERVDSTDPVSYDNEPWWWVDGVQVTAGGTEIRHRRVLVRARCLPPHRR